MIHHMDTHDCILRASQGPRRPSIGRRLGEERGAEFDRPIAPALFGAFMCDFNSTICKVTMATCLGNSSLLWRRLYDCKAAGRYNMCSGASSNRPASFSQYGRQFSVDPPRLPRPSCNASFPLNQPTVATYLHRFVAHFVIQCDNHVQMPVSYAKWPSLCDCGNKK